MTIVQIGLLLNSALYLSGVFVAGLVTSNTFAWQAAVATAGICYLAYFVQGHTEWRAASVALVVLTIVLGATAGVSLLM